MPLQREAGRRARKCPRSLMAHDVFICYSSEDKTIANAACAKLESAGIRCWIAPRDPIAGIPYGRQLVDAITAARIVLLIFSGNANRSEHVLRELEVASDSSKIIVPFRIENVVPSDDLRYYITRVHWLDAMSPPMESRLNELVALMRRLLDLPATPAITVAPVAARAKFGPGAIALLGTAVAALLALGFYYGGHVRSAPLHTIAKATSSPSPKRTPAKIAVKRAPVISAAQPTPRVVYVAAPAAPPVVIPSQTLPTAKPVPKATRAGKRAATPSPKPAVRVAIRMLPTPSAIEQSAPVPWHGPTAYPADWQIGSCTVKSQTLNFFTIPSGPYAGMTRLVSHLTLTGNGCALRFSYALYSADHAYLGTLTETYNAIGLQRRAQIGTGGSNFEFDRTRFGSAAYIVRRVAPQ